LSDGEFSFDQAQPLTDRPAMDHHDADGQQAWPSVTRSPMFEAIAGPSQERLGLRQPARRR
jgi:hypothetical protein